ncbi:MAG: MGMT family protein [Halobacteriales archaeon]
MGQAAGIFARWSPYLERYVQLGVAANRLISVTFPASVDADVEADHPLLDRFERYLDGAHESFEDVELALTVATRERRVLDAVRPIPYGHERDLEAVARATPGLDPTDDDDLVSVREALAANPVPVVVPDHRVRQVEGSLPPPVRRTLRQLEGLD